MTILRSVKSEYAIYFYSKKEAMIALDSEAQQKYKSFWKSNKGKKGNKLPSDKVQGFQMIEDEELHTLKIDFSKKGQFEIKDLEKANFKDL